MSKISTIIQREYSVRVRKKAFIFITLLTPVLFAALIIVPTLLTKIGGGEKQILVLDKSSMFHSALKDSKKVKFDYKEGDLSTHIGKLSEKQHAGILVIPPALNIYNPKGINLQTNGTISPMLEGEIEKIITNRLRELRMAKSQIDQSELNRVYQSFDLEVKNTDSSKTNAGSKTTSGIGYVGAILIYFFIFFFGSQVMRSVMEEKTNRIVEVIVSSVRPFQLMMGKIFGVALVALTQFLIWILLGVGIVYAVSTFLLDPATVEAANASGGGMNIMGIFDELAKANIPLIVGCFVFYFFGGYLLYAALFAAVGSAVDSETEVQQFMLPITLPLLVGVMTIGAIIADPNSQLSFWLSVFPLTAPISMMVRLPFIGFTWEVALSMGLIVVGFLLATMLAARIYRIGILMYGKKVNFKELYKWLFIKI